MARKVNYDDDGRHAAKREPVKRPRARGPMPLFLELPLLLVVAFCLAVLIRTFLVQAFYIPSSSMEQTLLVKDRVLVNKVVYGVRGIKRGEIIVFKGSGNWQHEPDNKIEKPTSLLSRFGRTFSDLIGLSQPNEKDFIKRVIGLPGDHIKCCDDQGRVVVNGQSLDEPYINNPAPLVDPSQPHMCLVRNFDEVIVPPGQLFVMGDHRSVSLDSRCSGTVPMEDVIGRAFVVVWPKDRWKMLPAPDSLADVPTTVASGATTGPLPGADATAWGVVGLPILASLAISARSVRIHRRRGRRLLW
ncbi:signal peptidase I [Luedemannella flava]|uniref:signal peptidase I n=1 Tax=Luedemannella flava TaxID=349316 RepID=UPI0031E08D20